VQSKKITDLLEGFRLEEVSGTHTPENRMIVDGYFSYLPDEKETGHCFNLNIDDEFSFIILDLLYFWYNDRQQIII
jgi:hypothetical protein